MKFVTDQIIFSNNLTISQKEILDKAFGKNDGFKVDYKFEKLPYGENALSKSIDEETMTLHHDKHHKKYFDNMMTIIEENPKLKDHSIIDLMRNLNLVPKEQREKFKNNAGGHYNHEFFWNLMSTQPQEKPSGKLEKLINKEFGSFEKFKEEFVKTALDLFGSGWVWLCVENNKLKLGPFPNQNNPHIEKCGIPLVGCDVWEHAYYLKYKNDRESYVKAWFDVVNWAFPEKILGEL
jgi:Fe-Mn family superoxide dismutase